MNIKLLSFGFKHGFLESDFVFDVRFLPNPYWVPDLKNGTGCDPEVALYVLNNEKGRSFLEHIEPFLRFLLAEYSRTDRATFTIGVGCTGGRHRSVAVVEQLRVFLQQLEYQVQVEHRDLGKE